MRRLMPRSRLFWFAALGVNAAWALMLPSRSGKLVAVAGVLSAVALIASARFRRHEASTPRSDADRPAPPPAPLPLLATFLAPALSFVWTPTIAFWILDGRAWLVIAWLTVVSAAALATASSGTIRRASPATLLFVFWTSIFWLSAVWDLGVGRFVMTQNRLEYRSCQSDPLQTIFTVWGQAPASEHLYLGWRTFEDFQIHRAYANHVHPYLFGMYAWVRGVSGLTGAAPYVATNTVPFFYMFVLLACVTVLLARGGLLREAPRAVDLIVLFGAYGLVVTGWRWWNDLYRFSSDNPYPLLAGVLVLVYALLLHPARMGLATIAAAVFVALSPIHTPMLVVALAFMFGRPGASLRDVLARNRPLILLASVITVAGIVIYLLPWYLIRSHGYSVIGSTLLFRSGLDGDTRYFTNMVQAVIAPCPTCCWGRPLSALLFPAFVPLLVFGAMAWRTPASGRIALGRMLLFLAAPYLFSLLLFPQSISIHPYMYDHLLLVPVILAGAVSMLQVAAHVRLNGTRLFALTLLLAAVLLSNLIALAQGLAGMPPR